MLIALDTSVLVAMFHAHDAHAERVRDMFVASVRAATA